MILHEISRAYKARAAGSGSPVEYDEQMYEIIQYINRNICGALSVSKIEREFFISRPSLNKRFKKATGTTVWDYLLTKRVVLANQMIRSGEPITKAALSCGFGDYSSFYRAYRKIFMCAPRSADGSLPR